MPAPDTLSMRVPALRVGHRHPLHESAEKFIFPRPKHEMKMIGHQAVYTNAHPGKALARLGEHAFEGGVISVVFEECDTGDAAVHDVVSDAARGETFGSSHGMRLSRRRADVNNGF